MSLQKIFLQARAAVARLFFLLSTGRYSRKTGIGIGVAGAALIGFIGYTAGPVIGHIITSSPFVPPLRFTTSDLTVLWGVHATVITLSLVALSFAWNSVRTLPTTDTIIGEIAYRLRSIETITFLMASNLCIGAGVLLVTGDVVTAEIGLPVGVFLIISVVVTVHRFWIVFDLLLHNTLDEKVFDFADATLSGKSRATASDYEVYLGHFFDECRTEIKRDRSERLREKLRGVEELIDKLLQSDSSRKDDDRFWEYVFGKYDAIYRQSIAQQNPELEKQVVASLSGVFYQTQNHGNTNFIGRTLQCFRTLFARGYSMEPQSASPEFLLERFENTQRRILGQFEKADEAESLGQATALVEALLETHTGLWRTAVEHEAAGAIDYLHHMLEDIYQFRSYKYEPPQAVRGAKDAPGGSYEAKKQDRADMYRDAINHLKFAAYGWAFNLFEEGDVSVSFIEQLFIEYVERDLGSVNSLTELFLQMRDATEPLNYWERWNIDREMAENYGVAMTGMAIHTWLLHFYCAALIWLFDEQETIEGLRERNPANSPLTEYERVQTDVDKIVEQVETYREEYPLADLLNNNPSIAERCDALIDYFEEVKSMLDEQEQSRIREIPVSDESESRYEEHLNSQLESADFRTAIETVGDITQVDALEEEANVTFSGETSSPRQLFVDDGRETIFQSPHHDFIDRYRRLVLDELDFQEREVDSAADIPNALADLISEKEVRLIICEHMDVGRILQDDERSERSSNETLGSHFSFLDVPVLRDVTTEFATVAFFDENFEYVEETDDVPASVEVTAGENVDRWDATELPDDQDIRDRVRIELSYNAHIETAGQNGVIFRISD